MTHGAMIAVHAAAAAARAHTKVLDAFRVNGATAPERARPLAELGLSDSDRSLGKCIATGVVRGVDARGRPTVLGYETAHVAGYYLDEAAYVARRDRRPSRRKRLVLVAIAVSLMLIGIATVLLVGASTAAR